MVRIHTETLLLTRIKHIFYYVCERRNMYNQYGMLDNETQKKLYEAGEECLQVFLKHLEGAELSEIRVLFHEFQSSTYCSFSSWLMSEGFKKRKEQRTK